MPDKQTFTEESERGQPVEKEMLDKLGGVKQPEYPTTHQPGMRVPKGGSSCATCRFLGPENTCKNRYFISYNGSNKLPYPADEYCSDWYEPQAGAIA